jgi:hypothetical protein
VTHQGLPPHPGDLQIVDWPPLLHFLEQLLDTRAHTGGEGGEEGGPLNEELDTAR